jgi:hypothetical protein
MNDLSAAYREPSTYNFGLARGLAMGLLFSGVLVSSVSAMQGHGPSSLGTGLGLTGIVLMAGSYLVRRRQAKAATGAT